MGTKLLALAVFSMGLALVPVTSAEAANITWEGPFSEKEKGLIQSYLDSVPGVVAARVAVEDVRRDGSSLIAAECRVALSAASGQGAMGYSLLFLDLRSGRVVPLARSEKASPLPLLDAYVRRLGPPAVVVPTPATPAQKAEFDATPFGKVSAELEKLGFENRADLAIPLGDSWELVRLLLRRATGELAVAGWDGRAGRAVQVITDLADGTQIITRSPGRQDYLETSDFRLEASLPAGTSAADLLKLHSERVNTYIAESRSAERRPIAPGEGRAGAGPGVEKRPISPMGLAERWMREYEQEIGFQVAMGLLQREKGSVDTHWSRALALRAIWAESVPVRSDVPPAALQLPTLPATAAAVAAAAAAASAPPAPPSVPGIPAAPLPDVRPPAAFLAPPAAAASAPPPALPPLVSIPAVAGPPRPSEPVLPLAVALLAGVELSDVAREVGVRAALAPNLSKIGVGAAATASPGLEPIAGLGRAKMLARSLARPAALPWGPPLPAGPDPEATIQSLSRIGPAGLQALLDQLATGDEAERAAAARALGTGGFRDDRVVPALTRAKVAEKEREASSGPTPAGVWIRFALCKAKFEPEANTVGLLAALKGEPAPVREEARAQAALALGELGERRALKTLLESLRTPTMRKESAIALGKMRAGEATAALLALLSSSDPLVRADERLHDEIVVALGRCGGAGVQEALWGELEKALAPATTLPTPRAWPVVRGLSSLAGMGNELYARYAKWRQAGDPFWLSLEFGKAVGMELLREWPPDVVEVLARDGSPEALEVLCRFHSERANPILDSWMKTGGPALMRSASRVAARCGLGEALVKGAALEAPRSLFPLLIAFEEGHKPSGERLAAMLPTISLPVQPLDLGVWLDEIAAEILNANAATVGALVQPMAKNRALLPLAALVLAIDGPLDQSSFAALREALPPADAVGLHRADLVVACALASRQGDRRATDFLVKAVSAATPSPIVVEIVRASASPPLLPVLVLRPELFDEEIVELSSAGDTSFLRQAYGRSGPGLARLSLARAMGRVGETSPAEDVTRALTEETRPEALRSALGAAPEIAQPQGVGPTAGPAAAAALLAALEKAASRPPVAGDRALKSLEADSAARIRILLASDHDATLRKTLEDPRWEQAEWAASKLALVGGAQDLDPLGSLAKANPWNRLGEAARKAIQAVQTRKAGASAPATEGRR